MDQSQLDALYQQYLGRGVDPSGAATWGNADYQTVINGILGSQEYQNRQQQQAPQQQQQPAQTQEPPPDWLRPEDYAANGYAAPYTQQQITSAIDPSWYRPASGGVTYASLKGPSDLSGGEYVVNPQTGRFALDSNGNPIPVPRPNDPNSFNSSIADTWIPAGIALMAAGTGLGAAGLIGEGAAAAGAGGELMGPTYGELGYTGLAEGAMGPTYAEMGYTGLNGAEAIAAADAASAAAALSQVGISGSTLASLLKGGASVVGLAKSLGLTGGTSGTSGTTGTTGINPNALANALKGLSGGTQTDTGGSFGLAKGNVNPFAYTKDVPTQTLAASKADPFAALNVPQTPIQPFNPLAHIVG